MRFDGCQTTGDQYFLCQNRQKPKPINEFETRAPAISLSHFNNISFAMHTEDASSHRDRIELCCVDVECAHFIQFLSFGHRHMVNTLQVVRNDEMDKPFLVLTYVMSSILRC